MTTLCRADSLRFSIRHELSSRASALGRYRICSIPVQRDISTVFTKQPPFLISRRDLTMEAAVTDADADAKTVSATETSPEAAESPVANKKLRIKLKSFQVPAIREAAEMILAAAKETDATVSGPVPLPTRRRLYCVLRSPHVDKDAREHFELRTHSRLIDIRDLSAETIDKLMGLDIPAGVDANIKII